MVCCCGRYVVYVSFAAAAVHKQRVRQSISTDTGPNQHSGSRDFEMNKL